MKPLLLNAWYMAAWGAEVREAFREGFWRYPSSCIGNADDIARTLKAVSDAGLTEFGKTVIPLLEQAGLRTPFQP
jgi:hypothetical protein